MALLTIPSVSRGQAASVALSKTELFALAPIAADAYFSVQANVRFCHAVYRSSPGNQLEVVRFDLSAASPTSLFLVSDKSRQTF